MGPSSARSRCLFNVDWCLPSQQRRAFLASSDALDSRRRRPDRPDPRKNGKKTSERAHPWNRTIITIPPATDNNNYDINNSSDKKRAAQRSTRVPVVVAGSERYTCVCTVIQNDREVHPRREDGEKQKNSRTLSSIRFCLEIVSFRLFQSSYYISFCIEHPRSVAVQLFAIALSSLDGHRR